MSGNAYAFQLDGLKGGEIRLADYAGRPMLIANTASACGFTAQYAGLEAIWRRHKDDGLVVIGVPCNQFGRQEPGDADEIASFCQVNYGVTFPLAAKTDVKGVHGHPLFKWLAETGGMAATPRWNFWKYLIARDGSYAGCFASITKPDGKRVEAAVARLLAAPAGD